MEPKAVFFDLGDTLVLAAHTTDPAVVFPIMARQVQPLLDNWSLALAVDLPTLLHEISLATETAQPARRARGLEVNGPFITRGAFASCGAQLSDEQAVTLWKATAIDHRLWGAQLYPDTIDTLTKLRDLRIPVAIVSNSTQFSDALREQLVPLEITELVAVIATSTDVMLVKPDPAPFRRALDEMAVQPEHVVFVGDSLEADIRGAKALGMTTVWKLNGRHEVPSADEADYTIQDLWELFALGLFPGSGMAALEAERLTPHEDLNADRY
jgi:HAD superfamily hydrolase (TIGR01662 family)